MLVFSPKNSRLSLSFCRIGISGRVIRTSSSFKMSATALDPTFAKAFRLLFSDEPDSADQLRAMLDDAIRQKYGNHKTLSSVLPKKLMEEESVSKDHQTSSPSPIDNLDDPDSEESNNSPDNELNELNILEEDLLCVVCRQMMQSDGNRLVECQECHGLYHQECHQPPINETEIPVNDPRLAWYCAMCKKKLNKAISSIKSHKPVVAVPSSAPASPKPSTSGGKPPFTSSKTYSSSSSKSSNAPTKSSSKASSSSSSSGPSSSSSSSGSGSSSSKHSKPSTSGASKGPGQTLSMISADKRLQMMKKKAAAANKSHDKKK